MKPIDLSLGEPKALIPPFLGPVLQEHLAEFGRYPPIKGIPALRQAIADWMGRRYPALAGTCRSPSVIVLPLNGSREGLFSAIFPALARKPGSAAPAVLIPNPFYQAYAAAAAASGAVPHFLAEHSRRRASCPSSTQSTTGCSEAHGGASISARLRTRKARSPRPPISRKPSRSPAATTFCCSPTNATRRSMATRRRPARSRRPTSGAEASPTSSRSSRSPSARAFRACGQASSPAIRTSSPPSAASAMSPARKCRSPSSMSRSAAWSDEDACGAGPGAVPRQFRPGRRHFGGALRLSKAGRSLLSLAQFGRNSGAARGPRQPFGKTVVSECCRELISRKRNPTGTMRVRTMSGSRSCMTPTPRARR